nr:class I tRNA ligase family protein [Mycoplasmopsis cynos]
MSKSKGNTISPLDVVKKRGADILRLWVANSEYTNDVTISDKILDQNAEIYRKIRNTFKFLLGNLHNYNYDISTQRTGIHLYIKEQLNLLKYDIQTAYNEFKFINVIKLINNYIVDLSSFYLSITKDILYIREFNDPERLMVLANMYEILEFLIIALTPILPTTCEEAYSFLNKANKKESIMLESIQPIKKESINFKILEEYKNFFDLRNEVNVLIEKAIKDGLVKRANELELFIDLTKQNIFKELDLKTLLSVGKITHSLEFKVAKFDSVKCLRCWNHFESSEIKEELCLMCYGIVEKFK